MEIPEDDIDLLGQTHEEVASILRDRDEIIKQNLIPDLQSNSKWSEEELQARTASFCQLASVRQRLSSVFYPNILAAESDLTKQGQRAIRYPLVIGSCVGIGVGVIRLFTAYDEFIHENRLTAWRTRELAKRRASDYAVLKGLTLGLSTTFKVTLFTSGCYALPLVFSAINGKTSFWEYAAGWGCTCSLYCLNRGLVPMLVGGLVGFVPGLAYGCVNLWLCRKLNLTFEQLFEKQTYDLIKLSPKLDI